MIFICIHFFELLDFKCYEDHECSYTYAAMVGRVMLCGVGSMFLVDSSLVQLFVSSNLRVLTTYVYSCHTSLTVMPLSVYVCIDLHAVMFAHCEHCIPQPTQLY